MSARAKRLKILEIVEDLARNRARGVDAGVPPVYFPASCLTAGFAARAAIAPVF